ncbi:MAG: nitroreductase/quinone reductase family protein [Halodesulfurarchaeum sp.]
MSSTNASEVAPEASVERAEPPLPDWAFSVVNPLVSLVLRSPIHWLLSDDLLLLRFTGRKSGESYTTPVGYRRDGDTLSVFTHSEWWRNLQGGAEVAVLLEGDWWTAHAEPESDPTRFVDDAVSFLREEGVDAAPRIGIEIDGDTIPSRAALVEGLSGTVHIEITLAHNR